MSELVDIPLALQLGEASANGASYASDAEMVNLMLERNPPGSRTPFSIVHTPGLGAEMGPGSGKIRGLCRSNDGTIWVIRGTTAHYSTDSGATWTAPGVTAVAGSDFCRMVDAGTHVVAVDGTYAYAINTTGATVCSRGNFSDVAYQDGYTIYAETDTDSLYVSSLDDPTTINALHFTSVDALPGDIIAVLSDHREVTVFKDSSIERYFNAGISGFPFQRATPGLIEVGIHSDASTPAFHTAAKHDGKLFWVNRDLRAYMMRGGQPVAISTPWTERYMLANIPVPSVASPTLFGLTFSLDGTPYYMISGLRNPDTAQRTALVYDIENGLWHVRYTPLDTDRYITHAVDVPPGEFVFDRVIVALYDRGAGTSTLRYMSNVSTNDSGASGQTPRVMTLPQYAPASGLRTFMPELYLDMQKASAASTVTLTWSDDGGTTYSSGLTGTANIARTRWRRLGSFYQRILRFAFSIDSKLSISGVRARIEVGE